MSIHLPGLIARVLTVAMVIVSAEMVFRPASQLNAEQMHQPCQASCSNGWGPCNCCTCSGSSPNVSCSTTLFSGVHSCTFEFCSTTPCDRP